MRSLYRPALLENPAYIYSQLKYFEGLKLQPTLNEYNKLKQEYLFKVGNISSLIINLSKGVMLYRARPMKKQSIHSAFDVNENDFFNNIKELGINSPERTKDFGRANRIGKPVFYSSLTAGTAIHEIAQWNRTQYKILSRTSSRLADLSKELLAEGVDPSKPLTGEYANRFENALGADFHKNMVVSEWEVQKPLKLACFFDDALTPTEIKGIIREANARDGYEVRDRPSYKSIRLIESFFAKQFTKMNIESQADYMLTALCTELVCDSPKKAVSRDFIPIDGIMYASVAEGYQGVNCVLTSEAVAAGKVKFVGANWHMVGRKDNFHLVSTKARIVSEETGELTWNIFKEDDESLAAPQ